MPHTRGTKLEGDSYYTNKVTQLGADLLIDIFTSSSCLEITQFGDSNSASFPYQKILPNELLQKLRQHCTPKKYWVEHKALKIESLLVSNISTNREPKSKSVIHDYYP